MDFATLLSGVAGRDRQAWLWLLREIGRLARHVARSHRLSDAECGDLVQTVVLVMLERMPVREPACLPAWLTTTLGRQARRMRSRRARHVPLRDRGLPASAPLPEVPSPEALALVAERDRALWLAAARLSSIRARRLVWLLAYRPELTQAQLAAELDISPGTVGPLRRRSLDTLRSHLSAAGYDPSDLRY